MWFEITGLVKPQKPATIKMMACVCYASTDGNRTDMLDMHKAGRPGFLSHNWDCVATYTYLSLCQMCTIHRCSSSSEITIKSFFQVKKWTSPHCLCFPFCSDARSRGRESGGDAGARFPCLVSGLTASCAATTTTTTSWICYIQLD